MPTSTGTQPRPPQQQQPQQQQQPPTQTNTAPRGANEPVNVIAPGGRVAQAAQEQLGYVPTFAEDPRAVTQAYQLIKTRQPLPDWLQGQEKQVEQAFKYHQQRNGNRPYTEWKYLPPQDPGREFLATSLKGPETKQPKTQEAAGIATIQDALNGQANWTDVSTDQRQKVLSDPMFYSTGQITKYPKWMQQQIIADPGFQWERVPKWQKVYYELSSSPTGMAAAQGGLLGLGGGPVGGVVGAGLGAALGWAAAKSGYDPLKEAWQQKGVAAQTFGYLNFAAEQAEKAMGISLQLSQARTLEDFGEVLSPEGWNAGSTTFEVLGPAVIDSAKKRIAYLAQHPEQIGTDLLQAVTFQWLGQRVMDAIMQPDKYKGEEIVLGSSIPEELNQSFKERLDEARQRVRDGENYREVMLDYQNGVIGQLSDMAGQAAIDPLNVMPTVQVEGAKGIATLTGNKVAVQALNQSTGLVEAARTYKTLVQTGQAHIIDPNFRVDTMGALSRFIAGVNEKGEVRAGPFNRTGLLDAPTPRKNVGGFLQEMVSLTPQSRAQIGAGMFYENVGALLTRFDDPREAGKYLKALANSDMETWRELGSRFAESPEFYTVLPALKAYNAEALDGILQTWDMSAPNRETLLQVSNVLGETPSKLLDDLAARGTADQDFQRIVSRLQASTDPQARVILDEIQAGRFTSDNLRQIVEAFTGDGALPWHPAQAKAMMLDSLGTHFDEWVTQRLMLDQTPEARSAFFRTASLMKTAQSILLLGGSPGYAITNGLSNMVHRAATGIFGYLTPTQINGWMERFGVNPARFEEGVGIGGMVEQANRTGGVKTEAQQKAVRGTGFLADAKDKLSKLSKGMPFSRLSSWFEKNEGRQAFSIAMRQFWSQSWRRGVGFKKMDAALSRSLQSLGIDPNYIYSAIEAGMNQAEIERALSGRFEGIQARSLITEAAQRTGLTASQAADILEKVGVLDELDNYLKGTTTRDGVDAAFRRAEKVAQDYMDIQTGEDLKAIAEHVKQKVGLEGAVSGLDVIQQVHGNYFDAWMDHYFRLGEVMEDLGTLDDPAVRSKAIEMQYSISDAEFRRINSRVAANYSGIFEVWNQSNNPRAMEMLAAIAQSDAAIKQAYDFMRQERRSFFEGNRPIEEWADSQAKIDAAFEQAFKHKHNAEVRMGESLGKLYEEMHGPAAGEAARKWWKDVTKFNDDIVKRERQARKKFAQLPREQREAAKQQYYRETKIQLIAEAEKINQEGIARLERVIRRGGGNTASGNVTPQGPRPDGGAPTNEVDEMLAAAQERQAEEARIQAERTKAVWDIAEEYARVGLPFNRGIFQDKFNLLAALKNEEFGGFPDLKGLEDERLTPDKVRSILDERAKLKKAEEEARAARTVGEATRMAQQTRKKPALNDDMTILRYIAGLGGINKDLISDISDPGRKHMPGLFTNKKWGQGWEMDEIAARLAEEGYPIDVNDPNDIGGINQATDLIKRALDGEKIYTKRHDYDAEIRRAEKENAIAQAEAARAIDETPTTETEPATIDETQALPQDGLLEKYKQFEQKAETPEKAAAWAEMRKEREQILDKRQKGIDLLNEHRAQYGDDSLILIKDQPEIERRPWYGVVLHPNTRGEGVQRTYFDARGFSGHEIFKTYEEAAGDAYLTGFRRAAPPEFLDEVAGTDAFEAGNRWTMLPDEQRYSKTIDDIILEIQKERADLWQRTLEQAVAEGDLVRMYEAIGEMPEELNGQKAPTGEDWNDYLSRVADETAARVTAQESEVAIAEAQARIEADTQAGIQRSNRVMTRRMLEEKFIEVFELTDTQANAYMELSDAVAAWYSHATGESPDEFYSRYYEDVVNMGEGDLFQKIRKQEQQMQMSLFDFKPETEPDPRVTPLDETPAPTTIQEPEGPRTQGSLLPEDTAPAPKAPKPGTLTDFGEKLGGARKDRQQSFTQKVITDDDIAAMPLSKLWPKEDIDAIEDTDMAALATAIRAEIPAKPKDKYKLRRWVEKVKTVRELMRFADEKGFDSFMAHVKDFSQSLEQFNNKVQVMRNVPRQHWGKIEEVYNYPNAYRLEGTEKVPAPYAYATVNGQRVRATDLDGLTAAIMEKLAGPQAEAKMKFEIRTNHKQYFINKQGDGLYRKLITFDSLKEARDYINNNYNELVAAWEGVKQTDNVKETDVRRAENRDRSGRDHRKGQDATPEMFLETFGFRGVEFGNWVSQGSNLRERQGMLNAAYDAMMDLADITGLPPKAISLDGTLGLGLGSRGSGKASAHFESSTIVINLTKTRGAGSFAHEWFHALDNYFQRKRPASNFGREGSFITYAPETRYKHKTTGQTLPVERFERLKNNRGIRNPAEWELVEGVRPEVEKRFADLVDALNKSPMSQRVEGLSKGTSDYWSRIIERAARSFENYVIDKMQKRGYHNDYLANVQTFEAFEASGLNPEFYPYLKDSELAPVAEAFDNLFMTVETRPTSKGVELFQTAFHGTPHKFNRFTLEKIGTGEGAQAYGWGLYFAGEKQIAEWYRGKLSEGRQTLTITRKDGTVLFDGQENTAPAGYNEAIKRIRKFGDKAADAYAREWGLDDRHRAYIEETKQRSQSLEAERQTYPSNVHERTPEQKARIEEIDRLAWNFDNIVMRAEERYATLDAIREIGDSNIEYKEDAGQLYEVDIPDEGYLEYDVPYNMQSDAVKEALRKAGYQTPEWGTIRQGKDGNYYIEHNGYAYGNRTPHRSNIETQLQKFRERQDSGQNIYERLSRQFGGDREASIALREAGLSGIKYLDGSSRGTGEGSYNFVIFDDEAIKILDTYYQKESYIKKGAVTFDADGIKATIKAFEAKDFSTLLHENAHVFRRALSDVAERTGNPRIREDLITIEEWAGVKNGEWTVDAEEKFARGFERYLREGNAPTPKLKKAFETFKRWLVAIYRKIKGSDIDVKLTDEVRAVFDRMLSEEPEVAPDTTITDRAQDILYQRRQKAQPGQMGLFGAGEDLPLFSGTAQTVRDETFNPQPVARQETMFDMRPQMEGAIQAQEQPTIQTANEWNAPTTESDYIPMADLNAARYSVYEGGASSRTTPIPDFPYKPGTWFISDMFGIYGKEIEHLTEVPVKDVQITEEDFTQVNYEGRGDDSRRYAQWNKEGKQAPPIRIVQMEDGTMKVTDGHRRLAAAKFGNREKILALVSYPMKTGKLDYEGKPIYTSLTYEGMVHGPERAGQLWDERQARIRQQVSQQKKAPDTLFQEANVPPGSMDAASQFTPQSESMDQGWKQFVTPLLNAMQQTAREQIQQRPIDGAFRDLSPEGQAQLRRYMKQVQNDMATTKLATVRHGEQQRDFAMLNYGKQYGFDRGFQTVSPYELYYTRSMFTWAARALDKPSWFSNYARLKMQQDRYERDIPERLRGKIKIPAPFLPDWMGDGLYIDPLGSLFFPAQFLKPFERLEQDKTQQQIEAERILQEWAADGSVSQADIQQAMNQEGPAWERALAEAQMRRESEIANPMDFFSTMFGPAWYLSTPLNAAGIRVPGISKGDPNKIGTLPLTNTARAIDTVTAGTWAEPIGDVIGLLGKPEEWVRKKAGLPALGEYGEYYTKRQIANMVAEGLIDSEEAQIAMIEQTGPVWDQATERVKMELAMRVPGAAALQAGLTEGIGGLAQASIPSLFGAGLLPAGELEYRGLKQEWNEAWKKYDAGDKTAVTEFFDEHPEYEAWLAKGKSDEELMKSFLIGQVWDGYMELGPTNQKQARAEMGKAFQEAFLNKETRSYESIDTDTLIQWAQMLKQRIPTAQNAQPLEIPQAPELELYNEDVTKITDEYFKQRSKYYDNYYQLEQGYYAQPQSKRAAYLLKNPELQEYWTWKKKWEKSFPDMVPIFKGQVFKQIDSSRWPPGLLDYVTQYAYSGKKLPPGARKALEQQWILEGRPMGDMNAWLNSQVAPAILYGNQQ